MREEQEVILQNLGWLPFHGKTLHFPRKKSEGIAFYRIPIFFN